MGEFTVRTKFPLVEPEIIPAPTEKEKTIEQFNAPLVAELEGITGKPIPEKCRRCKSLGVCATLAMLGL